MKFLVLITVVGAVVAQSDGEHGSRVYGLRGAGTAITHIKTGPATLPLLREPEQPNADRFDPSVSVGQRGSQMTTIGAGSGNPESMKAEVPKPFVYDGSGFDRR